MMSTTANQTTMERTTANETTVNSSATADNSSTTASTTNTTAFTVESNDAAADTQGNRMFLIIGLTIGFILLMATFILLRRRCVWGRKAEDTPPDSITADDHPLHPPDQHARRSAHSCCEVDLSDNPLHLLRENGVSGHNPGSSDQFVRSDHHSRSDQRGGLAWSPVSRPARNHHAGVHDEGNPAAQNVYFILEPLLNEDGLTSRHSDMTSSDHQVPGGSGRSVQPTEVGLTRVSHCVTGDQSGGKDEGNPAAQNVYFILEPQPEDDGLTSRHSDMRNIDLPGDNVQPRKLGSTPVSQQVTDDQAGSSDGGSSAVQNTYHILEPETKDRTERGVLFPTDRQGNDLIQGHTLQLTDRNRVVVRGDSNALETTSKSPAISEHADDCAGSDYSTIEDVGRPLPSIEWQDNFVDSGRVSSGIYEDIDILVEDFVSPGRDSSRTSSTCQQPERKTHSGEASGHDEVVMTDNPAYQSLDSLQTAGDDHRDEVVMTDNPAYQFVDSLQTAGDDDRDKLIMTDNPAYQSVDSLQTAGDDHRDEVVMTDNPAYQSVDSLQTAGDDHRDEVDMTDNPAYQSVDSLQTAGDDHRDEVVMTDNPAYQSVDSLQTAGDDHRD
ncbi:hypothetical protein ACOMHN_060118 [Nucella lapillus]